VAVEGSNQAVHYAAFDGSTWSTETLAIIGPDMGGSSLQDPQLVAQDNEIHVLYADCRAYQPGKDYPIDLILATWDGSAWSTQALYHFSGRCGLWEFQYQLIGDEAGRLAATAYIQSDSVLPSPQQLTFWLGQDGALSEGVYPLRIASQVAPRQVSPMGGGSGQSYVQMRGDGMESISIVGGSKRAQYVSSGGYSSQGTSVGTTTGTSTYVEGASRSGTSAAVVEQSYGPYGLFVERPRPRRNPCQGVPNHCMPCPYPCPPPMAGYKQIGYDQTRNFQIVPGVGWGSIDSQDYIFLKSCTIVRDGITCVDEVAVCAYAPTTPPPPSTPAQQVIAQTDLGDAPDSSNSYGQAMTAYPGTNAQFPTVKGAASPYGPRHENPLPMAGWLGPEITDEDEADTGSDADPTNNLIPTSDTADQDMADDSMALPIPISHCLSSSMQFAVAVPETAPSGVEWMVNVWFDWNRDGKWGDLLYCGSDKAPEWAVQNLRLGELEPGYHIFHATFLPYSANPSQPMWMRVTLSDESASSADGSGPSTDYKYGETEDYYLIASDLQNWSSSEIAPDATDDRAFTQMGNYPYYDQQRPGVQGVIRVRPDAETELQWPAAIAEVRITDAGFDPLVTNIAVGDTVRWYNDTATSHTVVGGVLEIDTDQEQIYLPLTLRNQTSQ